MHLLIIVDPGYEAVIESYLRAAPRFEAHCVRSWTPSYQEEVVRILEGAPTAEWVVLINDTYESNRILKSQLKLMLGTAE